MFKLVCSLLTEVALYFAELNLCVFGSASLNDGSARTDMGQFDFLPSAYIRSQYKKKKGL